MNLCDNETLFFLSSDTFNHADTDRSGAKASQDRARDLMGFSGKDFRLVQLTAVNDATTFQK